MYNRDEHFSNVEGINFNIIHNRCFGRPQEISTQHYKTIKNQDLQNHSEQNKEKALGAAF